jgi:hypothetical protein
VKRENKEHHAHALTGGASASKERSILSMLRRKSLCRKATKGAVSGRKFASRRWNKQRQDERLVDEGDANSNRCGRNATPERYLDSRYKVLKF